MAETVRVKGLRELQRAFAKMDRELGKSIDRELKRLAEPVATEARSLFSVIDTRSAAGFRPRMRGYGKVVVEQRLRRTTGVHPNYGALQMRRALIPAVSSHEDDVVNGLENMLDRLGRMNGF